MHIVLVHGLWLTDAAWAAVVTELERLGHTPVTVALPGQGDGATGVTLDDQLAAVVATVDSAPEPVVVVGHSAAASLAWLAADARPEQVAKVVFIGGFPNEGGEKYAAFFELEDGVMPFPGWGPFEGPDSDDISDDEKARIAEAAVPVPGEVAQAVVRLTDERRYAVPAVLVCPEFSPAQAREWIAGGDLPELARIDQLELVDIDSGHWPMFTQPVRLAEILAAV